MEININNAFLIAVKSSCEPCLVKYHKITEITLNFSHLMINYFLKEPSITIIFFSIFMLAISSALSIAFIAIAGVLVSILIILLIEGFILLTFIVILCMIISYIVVTVIIVIEIKAKILTPRNE